MKILNFGSLNIDNVFHVDTIVQPGQTISSSGLSVFQGGKGLNQSIAASQAGSRVFHAGAIGKDDVAFLKDFLEIYGVNTTYINTKHEFSGKAIIQCEKSGQNSIVLFGGANLEISHDYVNSVLAHFGKEDILLLQNEISSVPYIIQEAKKRGMIICFNPSPVDESLHSYPFELIDMIILNEIEGANLSKVTDETGILNVLLARYPELKIVLTLGEKGAIYADKSERFFCEPYSVTAVDTTGAGDTFTGFFISLMFDKHSIAESLKYASAAAAIAVGRKGAAVSIPTLEEVGKFITSNNNDKIHEIGSN